MIALRCLHCQHSWTVSDESAGLKSSCPGCGEPRRVPGGAEAFAERAAQRERKSEVAEVEQEELRFVVANVFVGIAALVFAGLVLTSDQGLARAGLVGFGTVFIVCGFWFQFSKAAEAMYLGVTGWILFLLAPLVLLVKESGADAPLVIGEVLKFAAVAGIFAVVQFQAVYAIVRKRQRVDRQAAERDYQG